MSFRVYTMKHSGSFQRVGDGILQSLAAHSFRAEGVKYLDVESHYEEDEPEGIGAEVGLLLGPPSAAELLSRGHHKHRLVMVAPNSDQIGRGLALELQKHATAILVPSKWAKAVVSQHVDLPVHVVPHGISITDTQLQGLQKSWESAPMLYESDRFEVTHFSTSASGRKGTIPLIIAWEQLGLSKEKARLTLVLDDAVRVWLMERVELPEGVEIMPRMMVSPEVGISRSGIVCQPSTGEGFGMIPLEARSLGVPVIATACSGHSEHMEEAPGVVVIPHLPPELVFDELPDAKRYRVQPEAIAAELHHAYKFKENLVREARESAPFVQKRWHWTKVIVDSLLPLLQE